MTTAQKVTAFIENSGEWKEEMISLRKLFNSTELAEDLKWGVPIYTIKNKNVVGMVGFKNHLGIWFHQGVFLKDPKHILVNAQKGKTKALRQVRIEKGDTIDEETILAYTLEAIENCKAGKEVKSEIKKITTSPLLKKVLKEDAEFNATFKRLTPGKQREYAEYITTAKQEKTKLKRIEKIVPMVKNGLGLNDKYKNG